MDLADGLVGKSVHEAGLDERDGEYGVTSTENNHCNNMVKEQYRKENHVLQNSICHQIRILINSHSYENVFESNTESLANEDNKTEENWTNLEVSFMLVQAVVLTEFPLSMSSRISP